MPNPILAPEYWMDKAMRDFAYCKRCNTTFPIRVPPGYTGDALVKCPNSDCGYEHPRQFEAGVAVGCEPPTSKPIIIGGR